jgi:hypothetical protein
MAHHRTGGAKKKVMVDDAIPAVFQSGKSGRNERQSSRGASCRWRCRPSRLRGSACCSGRADSFNEAEIAPGSGVRCLLFLSRQSAANGVALEQIVGPAGQRFSPKEVIQKDRGFPEPAARCSP